MTSLPIRDRVHFVYKDLGREENWYQKKYYYGGGNFRYFTFYAALNVLYQEKDNPLIIETGCQRQANDIGAGMSTSIFGEYVHRYGGRLITVDIDPEALKVCRQVTSDLAENISYIQSDSIHFLSNIDESPDLLYLDSYDYDLSGDKANQRRSQEHCLRELLAIESQLTDSSIILFDDNDLPGGGKPYLAKKHLCEKQWICILDNQQSLWIKRR